MLPVFDQCLSRSFLQPYHHYLYENIYSNVNTSRADSQSLYKNLVNGNSHLAQTVMPVVSIKAFNAFNQDMNIHTKPLTIYFSNDAFIQDKFQSATNIKALNLQCQEILPWADITMDKYKDITTTLIEQNNEEEFRQLENIGPQYKYILELFQQMGLIDRIEYHNDIEYIDQSQIDQGNQIMDIRDEGNNDQDYFFMTMTGHSFDDSSYEEFLCIYDVYQDGHFDKETIASFYETSVIQNVAILYPYINEYHQKIIQPIAEEYYLSHTDQCPNVFIPCAILEFC